MSRPRTVKYELDCRDLLKDLPEGSDKTGVLEEAAQYMLEEVLGHVAEQTSPVRGHGKFQRLSKDYKKTKTDSGAQGVPDLVFDGDMLDALKTEVKGNKIVLKITGQQGAKADGHCNQSGDAPDWLPTRRFIPNPGESLKGNIVEGIKRIIRAGD